MSRRVFALLAVMLLSLVLGACSPGGSSEEPGSSSQAGLVPGDAAIETVTVPTRWASAIASDLPTLTANSDAVFVGRVVRLKGQREEPLVSEVAGPASPADGVPGRQPGTFPVSTFEVLVEQGITGAYGASTVALIEQAGGISERADGSRVRLAIEDDQPLVPGRRYLFFVRQKDNGTLSVAPFARLLFEGEGLEAVPPWSTLGAMRTLSGRTANEAIGLVQAAGGR